MSSKDRTNHSCSDEAHDGADIAIRIVSQPRYLCVVRAALEALTQRLQIEAGARGQIILAVDEALTNVIRHGYKGRDDGVIWLRLAPMRENGRPGLEIVIEDCCTGIDLQGIAGRSLDEVRPGGLGVHIIRSSMDEVQYSPRPDQPGLRLRMRKFSQPPAAEQGA